MRKISILVLTLIIFITGCVGDENRAAIVAPTQEEIDGALRVDRSSQMTLGEPRDVSVWSTQLGNKWFEFIELPPGLEEYVNSGTTGVIRADPPEAGTYSFGVRVYVDGQLKEVIIYTLEVKEAP